MLLVPVTLLDVGERVSGLIEERLMCRLLANLLGPILGIAWALEAIYLAALTQPSLVGRGHLEVEGPSSELVPLLDPEGHKLRNRSGPIWSRGRSR